MRALAVRLCGLALAAVALGGPSAAQPGASSAPPGTAAAAAAQSLILPSQTQPPRPVPAATPPAESVAVAPSSADRCGAAELAGLVGRPRTEIPVPVDPSHRRVLCTTCPASGDTDTTRLTIRFDAQTGIVKQVTCQ